MNAELPFSPAADRNKQPILEALQRLLPPSASVLEIASGTGQHAAHFASACPGWRWQPSDTDASSLPAIDARCGGLTNALPAVRLDVLQSPWPAEPAGHSAMYCANLLHIAPWSTCAALMRGAALHLTTGGQVFIYGPFRVDGVPTAASNEAFDADLKARNPEWGLRRLSAVKREAAAQGLVLQDAADMPANNLLLRFTRAAS